MHVMTVAAGPSTVNDRILKHKFEQFISCLLTCGMYTLVKLQSAVTIEYKARDAFALSNTTEVIIFLGDAQ